MPEFNQFYQNMPLLRALEDVWDQSDAAGRASKKRSREANELSTRDLVLQQILHTMDGSQTFDVFRKYTYQDLYIALSLAKPEENEYLTPVKASVVEFRRLFQASNEAFVRADYNALERIMTDDMQRFLKANANPLLLCLLKIYS